MNWDYLHSVLHSFGFGRKFRRWISILYTQVGSHVLVNGWKTRRIDVTRGVRQGCPLSPLLYVLDAEPLVIRIRSSTGIVG